MNSGSCSQISSSCNCPIICLTFSPGSSRLLRYRRQIGKQEDLDEVDSISLHAYCIFAHCRLRALRYSSHPRTYVNEKVPGFMMCIADLLRFIPLSNFGISFTNSKVRKFFVKNNNKTLLRT